VQGTIEARGTNSWRVTVYGGRDPLTGKKVWRRLTVRGTKRDAERARAQLVLDVMDDRPDPEGAMGELLDQWYALKVRGFSPSTARNTRWMIDKRLKPGLGPVPLKKLRTPTLDAFYGALLAEGLSPGYVRRLHGVIHAALEQAIRWGLLDRNPASAATLPPVPASEITPPPAGDVSGMMSAMDEADPELAVFVRVAATTGTRRGQVCGLQWPDVNWGLGTVTFSRAVVLGPGAVVVKPIGKTKKSTRQVSLGTRTLEILLTHRERMADRAEACGTVLADDAFIFSDDPEGRVPWRPDSTSRRFRVARKRAGLTGRLHDLKHFAATQMLADGEPITTVAQRLGTDAATVLRVYSHFIPGADRKAADRMDDVLG
jgi:integrase